MSIKEQILKDNQGNNIGVFVPIEAYEKILDILEELKVIKNH